MADLSGILQTVAGASNLILVNPQQNIGVTAQFPVGTDKPTPDYLGTFIPSVAPPKPGSRFLFNYTGEDSVSLTSDITDHFVEDNTAIQDHIALKPEVISTQGYIGELTDILPVLPELAKLVNDKLQSLAPFFPKISSSAQRAYNTAAQVYQTANLAAKSIASSANALAGLAGRSFIQTQQQQAFIRFYSFWASRTLFTVQTPWAIFKDMAIQSLRVVQDDDTRMISTFEITFKKMRFANTITISAQTQASFQGRLKAQAGAVNDLGVSKPVQGASLSSQLPGG